MHFVQNKTLKCTVPFCFGQVEVFLGKQIFAITCLTGKLLKGSSFFVNLTRPCNPPSQILMKLREIIELVILSKMIPISTNLLQGIESYGPPKIATLVFTQALRFIKILILIFKMFINLWVFELRSSNSMRRLPMVCGVSVPLFSKFSYPWMILCHLE